MARQEWAGSWDGFQIPSDSPCDMRTDLRLSEESVLNAPLKHDAYTTRGLKADSVPFQRSLFGSLRSCRCAHGGVMTDGLCWAWEA